jgi:hypothetical protein
LTEDGFFLGNFSIWENKKGTWQNLGSAERVEALVFVLWLKTGGFFGTALAYTFFMFQFVVKICLGFPLSIFNHSAIILDA